MPHGEIGEVTAPRSQFYHGPYGRMFRNLPAYVPTLDLLKQFDSTFSEEEIAQIDPDTDEGQETILKRLARSMIQDEGEYYDQTRDNKDIPAGYTYFSQFITHDITFDPTSSLIRFNDPDKLRNFRTPRLDLDSLYGNGPEDSPCLYDKDKYGSLLVGASRHIKVKGQTGAKRFEDLECGDEIVEITVEDDLPRNSQGRPLIGDMRNDENIMISQLQLAFIKFHNKTLDYVTSQGVKYKHAFHEAQRLVRWHYQWVVLHDFLPKVVDREILERIWCSPDCPGKPKLCYYQWRHQPFIPVEFAVAAFRFGHSMIRNEYNLNHKIEAVPIFGGVNDTLIGFGHLKKSWTIQWDLFLNINNHNDLQSSRQIDTELSYNLTDLPSNLGGGDRRSLATHDLLRGYRMELPSGQAVARAMGEYPLEGPEEPLWYYILREAKELRGGCKLGPVGGRIVAEVIIGLLDGDPHSFLNVNPRWQPGFPPQGDLFRLQDILDWAEIPLTRQHLDEKFENHPLNCPPEI